MHHYLAFMAGSRGGQIIRNSRGPRPVMRLRDEDQCGRGAARMAKVLKCGKRLKKRGQRGKNADGIGKAPQRRGIVTCGPYRCDLLFVDKKW